MVPDLVENIIDVNHDESDLEEDGEEKDIDAEAAVEAQILAGLVLVDAVHVESHEVVDTAGILANLDDTIHDESHAAVVVAQTLASFAEDLRSTSS